VKRLSAEPLGPHPNLEHQQKLAKRLLRDVWAGNADALLTRDLELAPCGTIRRSNVAVSGGSLHPGRARHRGSLCGSFSA